MMETNLKSRLIGLAEGPTFGLFHIPKFRRLDLCSDRRSPQGRDGETVYSPAFLDSFSPTARALIQYKDVILPVKEIPLWR